jgi:hypothetical protein
MTGIAVELTVLLAVCNITLQKMLGCTQTLYAQFGMCHLKNDGVVCTYRALRVKYFYKTKICVYDKEGKVGK